MSNINTSPAGTATGTTPANAVHAKVEKYLNQAYQFRYNEVNGMIEFKLITEKDYKLMSDRDFNSIVRELINADIKCTQLILKSTLFSDFTPLFNPFKDYFQSLPAWGGQTDHIAELAQTVLTTDDALWSKCFKKWIVAAVACAINDSEVNHTVIVLAGGQGLGKTSWILKLVPAPLQAYCFSGTINPNNKDALIQLSQNLFINMDELENLNRSELGSLKELITKPYIRTRPAYAVNNVNMPRRASFVGSVNGREFLNDTTGNRRFLCFEALLIDYLHKVNMDLVYAQALHLFQTGFQHWFDTKEIEQINQNNSQFRNLSVEEELLITYFEPCEQIDADHFFTTTEILTWLRQKASVNLNDAAKQKMGKALRANGFHRIKRQNRWVYALKEPFIVHPRPQVPLTTKDLQLDLLG